MTETSDPQLDLRTMVGIEAWVNPEWKEELQRDPKSAMQTLGQKYGVDIPEDMEFRVHEDSEKVYNLVLEPSPAGVAPAEAGSEVQGFLSSFASTAPSTEKSGSTYSLFCNPYICSATSTRCYSHCVKSSG